LNRVARQALEEDRESVKRNLRLRLAELHRARIAWLNAKEGVRIMRKQARKLDEALD
jgi:hypothetical protein